MVTSGMGFQDKMDPLPECHVLLRFNFWATPAGLLTVSIAAEPL